MEFYGAFDYFFWLGVERGLILLEQDLPYALERCIHFKGKRYSEAVDAFKWGFSFGLVLTMEEYINLTTTEKPVKIEENMEKIGKIEKELENIVKNTINPNIVGNC